MYFFRGHTLNMKNQVEQNIKRSAFWERISRARLKNFLKASITELMKRLGTSVLGGGGLLNQLGVTGILVVDSSTLNRRDGAKEDFPGTATHAGIKWHACFDLLTGQLHWFELTPSSTNDHKCFPDLTLVCGKLVMVDLGYWDFKLLLAIQRAHGFFLSRIKSNTVVYIKEIIQGNISRKYLGTSLLSVPITRKRGDIVEVFIEKVCGIETLSTRIIGFWNPCEKCYHWYITNLTLPAILIYPLYRFRWQIELIFKSVKQSLNANRLTSNNSNIIESLLLASIAAHLASHTILTIAIPELNKRQPLAISYQRIAKVATLLARDFVNFLLDASKKQAQKRLDKIKLFSDEIFDPNYRHRDSSLARISRLLEGLL